MARDLCVHGGWGDPVTLVDFKAGLEDSARGVVTGLDWVILIVDQTAASVQMAIDMKATVEKLQDGVIPATRHLDNPALVEMAKLTYANAKVEGVSYVLNKISGATKEQYLRDRLLEAGISPIGAINDDTALSVGWLTGSKLKTETTQAEVTTIMEKLERAVRASQAAQAA
jgi:CO dehydrogenase nickel-insertion accessory protein CooC1